MWEPSTRPPYTSWGKTKHTKTNHSFCCSTWIQKKVCKLFLIMKSFSCSICEVCGSYQCPYCPFYSSGRSYTELYSNNVFFFPVKAQFHKFSFLTLPSLLQDLPLPLASSCSSPPSSCPSPPPSPSPPSSPTTAEPGPHSRAGYCDVMFLFFKNLKTQWCLLFFRIIAIAIDKMMPLI